MAKIIIVDDELTSLTIHKKILTDAGHDVDTEIDSGRALKRIKEMKYDVMLTDFNMPGMNGIELTREALKIEPELIVILITAYASVQSVVEAIKLGAYDYLTKPIRKDELLLSINSGLEKISLVKENEFLKHKIEQIEIDVKKDSEYPTASGKMKDLIKEAHKVARSTSTILITGANGTGKEVLAKYIYRNSNRRDQAFITINSAAIPEQLLESELFGHVRGSFTGAIKDKKGYFEVADNGTIFLDEIGEISPKIQVKLLRVLQEREFSKVGDTRVQTTNVRIIAATNRNLQDLIRQQIFREDLYYRLNVFEFHIPSLKDRPEDITFYFEKFVTEFAAEHGKNIESIDEEVKQVLLAYDWPGNIRELKNFAERVTILCDGDTITSDLLPNKLIGSNNQMNLTNDYNINKESVIRNFEINFLTKYLKMHNGNVAATARAINFHPVSLRQKLYKLGIDTRHLR